MAVDWNYFDKFENVNDKYLPPKGEGETKATQIVTAICKLVYKWYNDGDVFDNTCHMDGWGNDLSSYANWLDQNTEKAPRILAGIRGCYSDSDYEDLLKELADNLLDESYLSEMDKIDKIGSIYKCNGKYEFVEHYDYDEEEE